MPVYDLNGKVALVTGAARGIGYEAARQMHERGASIAVVDLDAQEAREAAERIGPRTLGLAADATDAEAMKSAVAEAVKRFGGLDIAIANAGIAPPTVTSSRMVPPEEWERVVEINLLGAWRTARAALPQICERQGQIVFVGSIYSHVNGVLASSYAVSKAGVEALGRAMRTELVPFGASASVVYFGWVDTHLVKNSLDKHDSGRTLEGVAPAFLMKRIPPATAGATIVRMLERRAPRAFAPGVWRYISAFRGFLNPIVDRRLETDARVATAVREAEKNGGADLPREAGPNN